MVSLVLQTGMIYLKIFRSIFYMLAELKTGDLPWMGRSRNKTKILKAKLMDFEYMHVFF